MTLARLDECFDVYMHNTNIILIAKNINCKIRKDIVKKLSYLEIEGDFLTILKKYIIEKFETIKPIIFKENNVIVLREKID